MKVYEVVTKFFDNGKVKASFYTYELDTTPENRCEETRTCDIYHDFFTNKKDAERHYRNAMLA